MTNVRGKFNYFACVAVVIVALLLVAILPTKVAFATSDMTFCILSYYELGDNQNGESQNSNGDYQIGGQNGGYQNGNQIVENESGSQNAENENGNNLNQKTLRYKVYLLKQQISESGQISENTQGSQNTQEEFSRNYFVGDYDNLQDALGIANEFREFQQNQNETESITVKKRVRVSQRQNAENVSQKSQVKTAIKKYNAAIEAKDIALAEQLLPETVKVIDKAKCDGIFHQNTAARKVSHLSKALSNLKAAK